MGVGGECLFFSCLDCWVNVCLCARARAPQDWRSRLWEGLSRRVFVFCLCVLLAGIARGGGGGVQNQKEKTIKVGERARSAVSLETHLQKKTLVPALKRRFRGKQTPQPPPSLKRRLPPWTVERPSARHALKVSCTPM